MTSDHRMTMDELPLPEYSERFKPRWPGDTGGYEADQMLCYARAYAAAAVAMEREKWESLCRAQGFLYMIEKRAKMK